MEKPPAQGASGSHTGRVTATDREYMRRLGAAMTEVKTTPDGIGVLEVCRRVDALKRGWTLACPRGLERELDLQGHLAVHETMLARARR